MRLAIRWYYIKKKMWFLCPIFMAHLLCPIYGHYVFWSVRPSVHPFVRSSRFRLKILVMVVFDEVEDQSTWNLVHMFPMIWSFNFNAKLEIFPHFHGPLNIENYSADEASVYWGHILVLFYFYSVMLYMYTPFLFAHVFVCVLTGTTNKRKQ